MEAVVFFIFFGIYIAIRVLFGGGETDWEKQKKQAKLGLKYLSEDQIELAYQYFDSRSKKRPFETLPLVKLGEIALQNENFELALAYGQKALRLDNTICDAYVLMARGFYGIGEFDSALAMVKKAVWFGRFDPAANQLYGKLLLESGDFEQGLKFMEIGFAHEENQTEAKPFFPTFKKKNNWF